MGGSHRSRSSTLTGSRCLDALTARAFSDEENNPAKAEKIWDKLLDAPDCLWDLEITRPKKNANI